MYRTQYPSVTAGVIGAVLLLAAACGLAATSIADIKARPADFTGREITVAGDVRDPIKLPFVPGFYTLVDSTGDIVVLTDGEPPPSGARVRIRARAENAATLGGRAFGLHLKELKRD
jgi:hypothetical protein